MCSTSGSSRSVPALLRALLVLGAVAAPLHAVASRAATGAPPPSARSPALAAAARQGPSAPEATARAEAPSPTLQVQPLRVKPGGLVLITVKGSQHLPAGRAGKRPAAFHARPEGHQALVGLPVEAELGRMEIEVFVPTPDGPVALREAIEVVAPGFRERTLSVAAKYSAKKLPKGTLRWIRSDRRAMARATRHGLTEPLFDEDFVWPREAEITAPYGDRRILNGELKSQHFGTDLRGALGAPIYASNDGVVVLTRHSYYSGNTVVIHHGADLYTLYFHLSEIRVKNGQRVSRGDLLGDVGSTGRVTGPHLHWSVRVGGLYVDPEALLALDFDGADDSGPEDSDAADDEQS